MFILVTEIILIPSEQNDKGEVVKFEEEHVPVRILIDEIIAYSPTVGDHTSAKTHVVLRGGRELFILELAEQLDTVASRYYGCSLDESQ